VYSQRLMTLFREAAHAGKAEAETHRGVGGTPGGGPYIVLSFRIAAGVVQEARFQTYGCPAAIACSEAACAWSEGEALARLLAVTPADVTSWVGGVPEGKEHCPALTVRALAQTMSLRAGNLSPEE
jgi:nitrogen fixation protein NifU and related proteins